MDQPLAQLSDQLWVPILTHYRDGAVDAARVTAHLAAIRGEVRSILLAGSTGDGWAVDDAAFDALLALLADPAAFPAGTTVMVGTLRDTTDNVVARIGQVRRALDARGTAATFAGITVCPPVDADATQDEILDHYDRVLDASSWPVAVYQLPQITGCTIAPETLAKLATHPKVTMFKDSSGADMVATSGLSFGKVGMVRGAEGGYLDHLAPAGRYHGWLLSTGNAFAKPLREILRLVAAGDRAGALRVSDALSEGVATLFAAAAKVPFANAFSNANRAADHILAHGRGWRDSGAPATIGGETLPLDLLETAEAVVAANVGVPERGYLAD